MECVYTGALPPPVDHRRSTGVREGPGLPVSCVHDGSDLTGDDNLALREALVRRICAHYAAAFSLLPVAEHPDLAACLDVGGGACLGLLEPRSNIIANAVIDHRRDHNRRRNQRRSSRLLACLAAADDEEEKEKVARCRWLYAARRSASALETFLQHYFRYLSSSQLLRYLYLADADLVVAVGLVETDLANSSGSRSGFTFHAPCPDGHARVGNALYRAAEEADHPEPLEVVWLARQSFDAAQAARFQPHLGKDPIAADLLPELLDFLTPDDARPNEEDLYFARRTGLPWEERPTITVHGLRRRKYGVDRIVLSPPLAGVRMPKPAIAQQEEAYCEYASTLKHLFLDAIHMCYLQAFARLADPAVVAAMHLPIVRAGFCFGALDDPVDNILANAIWFRAAFPSQSPPADDLRLVCSARLALLSARSRDAAVAYLRTRFAGTMSRHDATLLLYRAGGCSLARADELATAAGHAPCSGRAVAVRAAVKASGHGEEARAARFIHTLSPEAKGRVLSRLQRQRLLAMEDLDDIARDLYSPLHDGGLLPVPDEKPAVQEELSTEGRILLKSITKEYEHTQERIMKKLGQMTEKEVLCVFGATSSNGDDTGGKAEFFHVNFLARDVNEPHWDLFFAHIWDTRRKRPSSSLLLSSELDTSSMSRIQCTDLFAAAMSAGSCHSCAISKTKVFHPNPTRWSYKVGNKDDALCDDEDNLEFGPNYVYFNDQKDATLIEQLNDMVHRSGDSI